MQQHKTKRIAVKYANVDVNVIPLVRWFNKQQGIYTWWACEGSKGGTDAYISFVAQDQAALCDLVKKLQRKLGSPPEFCINEYEGHIKYAWYFSSEKLKEIIYSLKKH